MASPLIKIELNINPTFDELASDIQDATIKGALQGVNAGVNLIAGTQIESYTAGSRPEQPAGSPYNRTFTLQKSSKKIKAKRIGFVIEGAWLSQGSIAPYNVFVIGKRQARIHKKRWLTDKELATDTASEIQDEIENRIEIILRGL